MTTDETIVAFTQLFEGNHTAVGTEEGGCLRVGPATGWSWVDHLRCHLQGEGDPIGVYPMVRQYDTLGLDRWAVHWGCIDYDEGEEESWIHAINTRRVLEQFGITGWIERSRSKGYHVWVFLHEWCSALLVRQALLASAQLAGAPTREINPKQDELPEGKLGNYVRLPYPGALADDHYAAEQGQKRCVLDGEGEVSVSWFVFEALSTRCNVATLKPLAELYQPPARAVAKRTHVPIHGEEEDAVRRMLPLAKWIYSNGPDENHPDRSAQLFRFARILGTDGLHTHDEMFSLLVAADEKWGKFSERDDRDQRLNELLDKALREA